SLRSVEGRRREERRPRHEAARRTLMDVTDVLRDRTQAPGGFEAMVAVSVALHAVLIAGVLLSPGGWLAAPSADDYKVMTISLGGAGEGPRNGGISQIGGRPVQEVTPPGAKREAVRPP